MKTEIFNLIILDESGSMCHVTNQTISGCNETINTIKVAQQQMGDEQTHYVSIYAFQDNPNVPSRYLVKNVSAAAAEHITASDYEPWGSTPLYDAVGSTLADLKATCAAKEMAVGSVTIITDGYENASRHYTLQQVAKMIDALKEQGWNFNFIGANIDVNRVASSLNIDNALAFKQDEAGTRAMFEKQSRSRQAYFETVRDQMCLADDCEAAAPSMSAEERKAGRIARMKEAARGFFTRDENPDKK